VAANRVAHSPLSPHHATPVELQERLAAERAGNGFLAVRDGDGAQHMVVLAPDTERLTIGRARTNDLPIPWDEEVSRIHAEITHIGGRWVITDDGLSRNGTYVNGTRLQGRRQLLDRDEVRIGGTLVAVRLPAHGEGTTTRVAGEDYADVRITEGQRRVLLALCRPFKDGDEWARPATNQQIADELFLSINAVKTHMRALFRCFGLGDDVPQNEKRLRVVESALQSGMVALRDL